MKTIRHLQDNIIHNAFPHLPEDLSGRITAVSFTRNGGTSPPPFDSLNLCFHTGDSRKNVETNRRLLKKIIKADRLVAGIQVHGSVIKCIQSEEDVPYEEIPETDGCISSVPGMALMIKQADCQAVAFFDPVKNIIGNIHCGWRGNVNGIVYTAVDLMKMKFGCRPDDIWASISPGLGKCCAEFRDWERLLPASLHRFVSGDHYCDFKQVSMHQLMECGIPARHIYCSPVCTCCSGDFFSYRREKITGRCATVIMLNNIT